MAARKRYGHIGIVILQDTILSAAASLLAILLVRWISTPIPAFTTSVLHWIGFSLLGTFIAFTLTRSWRAVRRYPTVRSMLRLGVAAFVKELLLGGVLLAGWVLLPSPELGLTVALSDFLLTCFFLLLSRIAARQLADSPQRVYDISHRKTALVVGTERASLELAEELERSGDYTVVALTTRDRELSGRVVADRIVVYCEDGAELDRLQWTFGGIDCIFLPKGMGDPGGPGKAAAPAREHGLSYADGMSAIGHFVKRTADMACSGLLLVFFSPLIALCALAVKLGDGGPAIYAQERIGLHGRPFKIYKFRTMRTDAEAQGAPVLAQGEADPRLTRTGRFLRAHHLDELPQLWNVFKGDMSLVGYRPERAYYIDRIMDKNPRYRFLYQMRPGVTSYATLYNGYTDNLEKMLTRLELDLYYLRNRSVWFDAKVLGLTFLRIVFGRKF